MHFSIESQWHDSPDAKASKDLQAALEKARDLWVQTTPQVHPVGSEAREMLERSEGRIAKARLANKDAESAELLRDMVSQHAALVKSQSASLTPDAAGCVDLMNKGIAAAMSVAAGLDTAVRVTIAGEFNTAPARIQGGHSRLRISIDDATYG